MPASGEAAYAGGRWRRTWEGLDRSGLRAYWVAVAVALGLQLVLFLAVSTFRYHRFDLYTDFGTYAQAFSVIAHGNLDPFDTFQTYPFWQNHFELAMWPIGLLGSVWPHPIVLLWMQDVAVVATELVALLWIGRICAERVGDRRQQVALIALVATVANAWWWEATIFDVHFETFGMPFALLGAYALWQGRYRTAWAAALVALLFGDVVALSILFVGVAGLLSARVRTRGRGMWHAAGLAALGRPGSCSSPPCMATAAPPCPSTTAGSSTSRPNASSWAVFGALAAHPSADLHVLRTQAGAMWRVVATGGGARPPHPLGSPPGDRRPGARGPQRQRALLAPAGRRVPDRDGGAVRPRRHRDGARVGGHRRAGVAPVPVPPRVPDASRPGGGRRRGCWARQPWRWRCPRACPCGTSWSPAGTRRPSSAR